MRSFKLNVNCKPLPAKTLAISAMFFVASCSEYEQSDTPIQEPSLPTSNSQPVKNLQRVSQTHTGPDMSDKAKASQNRAKTLRETAKARAQARKADIEARRQDQRAKTYELRAQHEDFKSELLAMLIEDGIIDTQNELSVYDVKATYKSGDILINGSNVSQRFDGRYEALWAQYNRVISDLSYIHISPNSYEIREVNAAGGNYHYQAQSN